MDSKKLLVFSDTHGSIAPLKAVMNWAVSQIPPAGNITAAAFLGDGVSDLKRAADETGFYCDWAIVSGNNDFNYSVPEAAVFDFCGYRFFLSHGHRHSLFGGYHSLIAAARNVQAHAVLFGHTHVPSQKITDGILLVNPGSVSRPRSRVGASFAVIECIPGESNLANQFKTEFFGIKGNGAVTSLKI